MLTEPGVTGWSKQNQLWSKVLHLEELPGARELYGVSNGPFVGDGSALSCACHFLGPLAGFCRRLREVTSVMVAHSRVSWGGRSLREQRAQSPHPAGEDPKSWDGEQGESHGVRGSWLFHPPFGNPSSPKSRRCHKQCHCPLLISSSRLALALTPCWHRCLLPNELCATNSEFCLEQAASLDLFCF